MILHHFKKSILYFLLLLLFSCNGKKPLIRKDLSNEIERKNTLFVFIGEKIDVRYIPVKDSVALMMDEEYVAKYRILQRVYGDFKEDTIEFTVFDHYGEPAFSRYNNVMLFVYKYEGKYYHQKYQFYDVYKTKDDKWAGSYSVRDLGYDNKRNKKVSAQKIDFTEDAFISLELFNKKEIGCWFPEPYYKIEKNKAVPIYGNYAEDLFKIKKEKSLARFFEEGKPIELDVIDTEMAEIVKGEDSLENDWKNFGLFWNIMRTQPGDTIAQRIYDFVLDSIVLKDTLYSEDNNNNVVPAEVLRNLQKRNDLDYRNIEITRARPYFEGTIVIDTVNTFETTVKASFVKNKAGFKLYSIKEERKCICWQ